MTDEVAKRPVAVACAGAFAAALGTSLVAVSMPEIAKSFSASPKEASWVLSAYLLVLSCGLPLAGRAADLFGRRRVYLTGVLVFVCGSFMCSGAPTLPTLVGARVFQGAGASVTMAVGPAIVTSAAPPSKRARALGIQLAVTYFGLAAGPSIGGVLAAGIGWHAVFSVVAAAASVVGVLGIAWLAHDDPKPVALRELDLGGAALFAVALGALLYALRRAPDSGWTSTAFLLPALFAVVAFYAFARNETLHPSPLLPLGMLRSGALTLPLVSSIVLYVVAYMLAFVVPFHLQHAMGMSAARAGVFMTAQPAAMAVVAPLAGWIADRVGRRAPATLGMLVIACGVIGARAASGPGALAAALAVVGVGAGLFVAPNGAAIMAAAGRGRQGTGAALMATARNVGMTWGIAIAASVEPLVGFHGALAVGAAVAAAGAVVAAARP